MSICQRCENDHDRSYGTGRYCSKKCAFTKNENQLIASRQTYSDEVKKKMSKPKADSSKMGKHDKKGDKNPNSKAINGALKDRKGKQYENICASNKRNGLGWSEANRKMHSVKMLGESNWMRGKTHSKETIDRIKATIRKKYESGIFNSFVHSISKAEREIIKFLIENNVEFIHQFIIKDASYRYDFYLPAKNLIVEYYGDFWHGNPLIYKEDKMIGRGNNKCLASEKWKIDNVRNMFAKTNGFEIMIVWENDFKKNKLEILNTFL